MSERGSESTHLMLSSLGLLLIFCLGSVVVRPTEVRAETEAERCFADDAEGTATPFEDAFDEEPAYNN